MNQDKPSLLLIDDRPIAIHERREVLLVGHLPFLQIIFIQTHMGNFRLGVDCTGDEDLVFGEGPVEKGVVDGKLGVGYPGVLLAEVDTAISNGVDLTTGGPEMFIDFNPLVSIVLNPRLLKLETLHVRKLPDRDEDRVYVDI